MDKAMVLWAERNLPTEDVPLHELPLGLDSAPCLITPAFFDVYDAAPRENVAVPLNIQAAVKAALPMIDGNSIVEILDCDMAHFRPAPQLNIGKDEIWVDTIYENWHLKSNSDHYGVVQPYLNGNTTPFNGGFVPILARASTLKKIINDWAKIHIAILKDDHRDIIKWWAGMYSLQVACANNRVHMRSHSLCYIPGITPLTDEHYIVHYSVDKKFDKKDALWPFLPTSDLPKEPYYDLLSRWQNHLAAIEDGETHISDERKQWISEQLLLGHHERAVLDALSKQGLSRAYAAMAIGEVKAHPYFLGAQKAMNPSKDIEQ